MKKVFCLLFIFSCTQKEDTQQKAESAVKAYIRQNAIDASSYEPVSFGKLDSVFTLDSNRYYQLDINRKAILNAYKAARSNGENSKADSLQDQLVRINNIIDADREFVGLKLYHVSQGKNEEGKVVMNRGTFYLDSSFKVKEFVMSEDSLMVQDDIPLQ
jgi:hypothetical protein